MSATNPVRALMNKQIDYTLSIIEEIAAIHKNPTFNRERVRITSEIDFMLGVVWASCFDNFLLEFQKLYRRRPNGGEHNESILAVYERAREIKQTIIERLRL